MSGDLIITNLFIFALAGFLGFECIRRVPKLLHTPLMALTNALSAIALVGSLVILGQAATTYSIVLGFEVIRRVPKLLHTPLMALTNALSAIALVGSLVILGQAATTYSIILGFVAVVASTINVVGGFLLTDRMLKMFKRREPTKPRAEAETEASP